MIKNIKRRKVDGRLKYNIWAADLAEKKLSSCNRGLKYLVCAINFFTKYAWVKPLEDKHGKIILHGFSDMVKETKR